MPRRRDSIRVTVVDRGRRYLYMRFVDPVTDVVEERSTGCTSKREAEREAAKWESSLQEGRYKRASLTTWTEFVDRYTDEVLKGLSAQSLAKSISVLGQVEALAPVARLSDMTSDRLSTLQASWRASGLAETTIQSKLATLRAAMSWAVSAGILQSLPRFPRVQRAKVGRRARVMKGRPLTDAEFSQMLKSVSKVIDVPQHIPAWRHYLTGLWLSGLRLEESLAFSWDDTTVLHVDLSEEFPTYRVYAEGEKGNADRIMPMTPDFAEFLLQTPQRRRTGPVFPLPKMKGAGQPANSHVSRLVSEIGRAAGIVVDARTGKHASAHDLRRSFGSRWAKRVMPQVLRELMRHESIDTTMRYYVGEEAQSTARELWKQFGDTSVTL